MLEFLRRSCNSLFEPRIWIRRSKYNALFGDYVDRCSKLNAANDKVSDLTAANKNLQTNIETYQAERDKLHVRIDAAIKALQL